LSGIFGYLTFGEKPLAGDKLQHLLHAMKLAGYGVSNVINDNTCSLGEANMPSPNYVQSWQNDTGIAIASCGDICDGDVKKSVLALYRKGRLDLLKNLNGVFAAALYDRTDEKLTIVNDRYGVAKLFYHYDKHSFGFAPKIKPLLALEVDRSLRNDAIVDFFLFGYLLGDKTLFRHVHKLPPASILEVTSAGMRLAKYWDYEYADEYDSRPLDELTDELGDLWQAAVERRIRENESIMIPLSGGLDSRAILAAALRYTSKDRILTFTFGEKGSFDFEIGKLVAERAGVRNIPLGVERHDFLGQYEASVNDVEGMIDATPYFPTTGYRQLEAYVNTLEVGYMGDPIMGSHISSSMLGRTLRVEKDFVEAKDIILAKNSLNALEFTRRLFHTDWEGLEHLTTSIEHTVWDLRGSGVSNLANFCAIWDYRHRQNKYSTFAVLRYGNCFNYSMPFLDNDVIDFMLGIPANLRVSQKLYKLMLVNRYPALFDLPVKNNWGLRFNTSGPARFLRRAALFSKMKANASSTRLIKRNIFLDQGKNYIDYDDLLRQNDEYRSFMRGMIEKVKQREYFDKDYIEHTWRLHMQGRGNHAMLFGLLVTFELFLERFVDE